MCGITGLWAPDSDENLIRSQIEKAVASLRHRGPDDEGTWTNGRGFALGHTRLTILDLTSSGHQPMTTADGRYTIVFNGEIYNFAEIRSKLVEAGHEFVGTGDTEVVLHAFSEWGADAVDDFIGMFAIALWDEKEQMLQLIRDRLGVKPLHYSWDGKAFCFGSELKALRCFRHWRPEVNRQALGEYLQYGYIAGDRTIYDHTFKLPPAHRLVLRQGQQPIVERYWSVTERASELLSGSEAFLEAELESRLIDSVRLRMVSDVPVGVYLSGGIDSSIVTALLSRHHPRQIRTFTIGFGESTHNEARWAKAVAEHCGTRHTEYILGVGEALEIAKSWGSLFDEPFGDSSGIPTLLVSRLAGQDVKVVLSADGGDELFSGYDVYALVLNRMRQFGRMPRWLSRSAAAALAWVPSRPAALPGQSQLALAARTHRLQSLLQTSNAGKLMNMHLSHWQPEMIGRLIGHYENPRADAGSYGVDPCRQLSFWDLHHYLPEDILTKVDRTTMAVSIEGREPLLDHRLVEFALALPEHLRRGQLGPKHLLKSVLYRYVPRELVDRPKQGFAIPLSKWMMSDLKHLVRDYLQFDRVRSAGYMDPALVQDAVERFYRGDLLLGRPLWLLLAFEMWRENWGPART